MDNLEELFHSLPLEKPVRVTKKLSLAVGAISPPGPDNYRCQQCKLFTQTKAPFNDWPPTGEKGTTVIVTSSPLDSDNQLWYDIRLLLLKDTGLDDDNVTFLSPVLCVPYHKQVTMEQLRLCRSFVENSLSELQPARILAMGANAVRQVAGEKATVKGLIGAELDWHGVPLFVTYEPLMIFAGMPQALVSIRRHILRMMQGLKKKLPDFPGWRRNKK
jgi:hypothetical protein